MSHKARIFPNLVRFALLLLVFFLLFSPRAEAGERFVLGAEDQAGPWGRSDGTGCGNDIVNAAFAVTGDSVILEVFPYGRAKKMAIEGELMGCFAMSWEPALEGKIVLAAKPLYQVQVNLLGRRGAEVKFRSLDELPPKSVLGLVKDYEYPPEVRAVAKRGVRLEEVASEVQNLKKLAAGRIDATVVNCDPLKSLALLLKQAAVEGKVDSVCVVGVQGSYVGFSVLNSSGLQAKEHFDRGMAIILTNGTYDSIVQSWVQKYHQPVIEGRR